jgi:hypothetical protein
VHQKTKGDFVTKAILVLDPDGVALAPVTLCAEAVEEARKLNLPLFDQVLAQLSEGKEIRASGDASYDLFQAGERIAVVEVLDTPA